MVVKLQRPILVGGLGLSFSLWMLQNLHHSMVQIGEFGLLSLLAVGGGLWLLKSNRTQDSSRSLSNVPVDRTTVEASIAKAQAVVNQLAQETENPLTVGTLREQLTRLTAELDRQEMIAVVTGGKSVGKTTLIEVLKSSWCQNVETGSFSFVEFQETSPLFVKAGENSDLDVLTHANKSDVVLFLTNGDLTDSEFQSLQQLKAINQNTILVFNKQDQYLPDERVSVLQSLKHRMSSVVATAASPSLIKVRKHQEDGCVQESLELPTPDIQQLTQQLGEMLTQQPEQLVWATTMRKVLFLKAEAKNLLNEIRRDRAVKSIEQYQWIAAAAAFANPVPALDILATAAINAQMVMDLGGIYQQKFSLEQAQTVAGTMGSLMVKLGLVELSSKAVSTVLKTNAITFVAGGLVQGVSAAYLTRIAGLTLVEYFQQQEVAIDSGTVLNLDKLRQTLQSVFQRNQQMALLQSFVKQSVKHLTPQAQQLQLVKSEISA
ncbi:hypothetical protein DP113_23860 [Brasilonema octagenarum UFV-E1]|uniref:DUF697 domain-containing protein n=1 Tax=Brasilonema sennae CENA114 TaxID=415709 RepID=A0A856MQJ1_9CYAN|nr:DUF697 domain-containing protein [Brasilonema sennae]QDL12400.1 hypothetical protein DP114_23960 [Brasilonema sennae CENA114]QDL18785.1 hypothetical protein DP113_23860 [Brasilonema octagenarum UFV-E1]